MEAAASTSDTNHQDVAPSHSDRTAEGGGAAGDDYDAVCASQEEEASAGKEAMDEDGGDDDAAQGTAQDDKVENNTGQNDAKDKEDKPEEDDRYDDDAAPDDTLLHTKESAKADDHNQNAEGEGEGGDEDGADGVELEDANKLALEPGQEEEDGSDEEETDKKRGKYSKADAEGSDEEGGEDHVGDTKEVKEDYDNDGEEEENEDEEKEEPAEEKEGANENSKGDTVKEGNADETASRSARKRADGEDDEDDEDDVNMKDVETEGEGNDGTGDVEEACSGVKAEDKEKVVEGARGTKDAEEVAQSKSKANGLKVDTTLDEDEKMEEAGKEDGKEAASSVMTPMLGHVAGAARLAAASNRAPSPAGSRAGVSASASKAQLAAKLKSRPLMVQLQIGGVVVKKLGNVVFDRPAYHTRRFIYPVGFLSERSYASYRQPGTKTVYTCEVLDGGVRPEFKITVSDDMDNPIVAADPTAAWRVVEQRVQAVPPSPVDSRPQTVQRLCGAAYFGLAHPSVIKRLQEFSGAKKCLDYLYDKKHQQLNETVHDDDRPVQQSAPPVSPSYPALATGKSSGGAASASRASEGGGGGGGSRVTFSNPDLSAEWLPIMEKV